MGWGHMSNNNNPYQNYNPYTQMYGTTNGLAAQQGMMNQAAAAQQYAAAQQRAFNNIWQERRWAIDGKFMSLQDFVNYIWPEDCAEKTFFILKHTKENE